MLSRTWTWTYTYDQDGNRTATSDARPSAGVSAEVTAKAPNSSGALTSPVFSTSSGSNQLLLALVSSDGPDGSAQTSTVTGAGLTWSLVSRANSTGGTAEIWKATPTAALTNVSVTATQAQSGYNQALTVEAISGTTGVGASNHSSSSNGTPATSVTTTAANSLIFGVGNDPYTATARTPASGQAISNEQDDTATDNTQWTQKTQVPVPSSSTAVSVGVSAPTGIAFNMAAVEVKAATGGSTISQSASYNALDELTALNGSTTGLSYDADGNETANPGSATRPGSAYAAQPSRSESYNDRDQQTGITAAGANPLQKFYLGETNTTATGYYDSIAGTGNTQTNTMLGLVNDNTAAGSNREFLRTPDGLIIGGHVSAGSSYFLTDNLGSTVGKVDGNQSTQATYSYDPVGNTRSTSGPYPLQSNNPIGYAAGYQTTTGLIKFGARYYDPNIGRFTQQDPSGQEDNPYAYTGNNAVNFTDPDGYFNFLAATTGLVAGAVAGAGAALVCGACGVYVGVAVGAAVGTGLSTGASSGNGSINYTDTAAATAFALAGGPTRDAAIGLATAIKSIL